MFYLKKIQSEEEKKKHKEQVKHNRRDRIIHLPNRIGMKLLGMENYKKVKKLFGRL